MSLDQLQKDVKAGNLYPVYLFHGDESLIIDQATAFLEEHLLQEHERSFDQVILYGMDVNARQVMEQLMLFPLLGARRVVCIREAQQLEDLKELESYVRRPAPSSILILSHKNKALDKRTKLFEALKQSAFIISADKLKGKEVIPWLMKTASSMQLNITNEAASAMVELIGEEISLLQPELKKLTISHAGGKQVTGPDILDLVGMSREYNVFELQNAIEAGNVAAAMRIGTRMGEQKGYSIIPLIALLYGFYTRILAAKSLGQANDAAIGEAIGNKNPYVIGKAKEAARKYSMEQLEYFIQCLHHYDMKSKGWNNPGADHRALTIELLDTLLIPAKSPMMSSGYEW